MHWQDFPTLQRGNSYVFDVKNGKSELVENTINDEKKQNIKKETFLFQYQHEYTPILQDIILPNDPITSSLIQIPDSKLNELLYNAELITHFMQYTFNCLIGNSSFESIINNELFKNTKEINKDSIDLIIDLLKDNTRLSKFENIINNELNRIFNINGFSVNELDISKVNPESFLSLLNKRIWTFKSKNNYNINFVYISIVPFVFCGIRRPCV